MLAVDTLLQDRYRILSHIGKGGMGAVYLARDENLGVSVAVKQNFFTDDRLIEAFKREARLLASLRHPALPQVKDYFIDPSGQFLVMEYIGGDDLGTVLEKRFEKIEPVGEAKPFEVNQALDWAEQLLDALDYLHTRTEPVIHRDIKPQNLKLAERNQIILLDFGLAKGKPQYMTRVTTTGSIYGYTPSYSPIEQIRGLGTDPRSDLYGLGATIYHLLTGVPPVDATTRADAFLGGEPDPVLAACEMNPKVPQSISDLLMKAMEQHRNKRPASAVAMLNMLRAARHATVINPQAHEVKVTHEVASPETQKQAEEERIRLEEIEQQKSREEQELIAREEAIVRQRREAERKAREASERLRKQNEQEQKAREEAEQLYAVTELAQQQEDRRNQELARRTKETEVLKQQEEQFQNQPQQIYASQVSETGRFPTKKLVVAVAIIAAITLTVWAAIKILNKGSGAGAGSQSNNNQTKPALPAAVKPETFVTPSKVYKVSLGGDSQTIASAGDESVIRLWQGSDRRELKGVTRRGRSVAASSDGQMVASGGEDGEILIWRTSDGQIITQVPRGHSDFIFSIGFSPDGQTLFTASGDKTIKIWRTSDGTELKTVAVPEISYLIVTVSPDLKMAGFYREDGSFKLWSLAKDELIRMLDGDVPAVTCGAFSNDGQMLALGSRNGDVQLWRTSDGRMIKALGMDGQSSAELDMRLYSDAVTSIVFSADGQTIAAGLVKGTIKLWSVSDGRLLKTLTGHTATVNSLAFSADGRALASASDDKTVRVWNPSDDKQ